MDNLIDKILDWPVIVQGAIGSALFTLILYLGQKAFTYVPKLVGKLSAGRRRSYLQTRLLRMQGWKSGDLLSQAAYASALVYRASRDLLKALIWLTLGLLFTNLVGVWGVVGYLGCIYHLFFALEVVKARRSDETKNIDAEIAELRAEIAELEKEHGDA